MGVRVSRQLKYSDRFGNQQGAHGGLFQLHQIAYADTAIQGDPIRALVELITNCDDAYNKMASHDQTHSGVIDISVTKGPEYPYLSIRDRAIGMNSERMDEALGSYTSATSEGTDRGYFGRGLKDAILALGAGEVESIVDGFIHRAWLGIRGGYPYYEAQEPVPASQDSPLNRAAGNGTTVRIKVNRPDVILPTYDNLVEQIPLHFMLRNILSNHARAIILKETSPEGGLLQQEHLSYRYPQARLVLDNSLRLNRLDIPYRIRVYETSHGLSTPYEAGHYAEAGILITDGNAILDNTLGRFDTHPSARVFYGQFVCPYINELMRSNEAIVKPTRVGLDWTHEVARELRMTLEERLEPLVRDRARRELAARHTQGKESLRVRLREAVAELNRIADKELSKPTANSEIKLQGTSLKQFSMFHRIVFDDSTRDGPRAWYDRRSGDIIISTAHPSIAQYISDSAEKGIESPQGQVILAELLLQTFSREVSRIQMNGGRSNRGAVQDEDALQARALHLQDLYSNQIHAILVDRRYRLNGIL